MSDASNDTLPASGHLGRVINAGLTAFRVAPKNHDAAVESVARALE